MCSLEASGLRDGRGLPSLHKLPYAKSSTAEILRCAQDSGCGLPASLYTQPHARKTPLLHFDSCAGFGELLLDGLGFFLRDAFLHRIRRAVDQVFGFFKAE